tara:strand:+ start:417 stop:533 length:117 start_codon:yes stop_codon:yes gene_type:complete
VVFAKGKRNRIKAVGEKIATRMAVSRNDVGHVFPETNE